MNLVQSLQQYSSTVISVHIVATVVSTVTLTHIVATRRLDSQEFPGLVVKAHERRLVGQSTWSSKH
jgi:hypothetical protein